MIGAFDTVILAGGSGSRLKSLVSDRPKCLAEINGQPFLHYLFKHLAHSGVDEVIMSTGYMTEQVETMLGKKQCGVALRYSREDQPLGTGGAVKRALSLCRHKYLMVINGDSFLDFNRNDFLAWFDPKIMSASLVTTWQDDCSRYGQVEFSEDGQILSFSEKSNAAQAGWINAGIYLIPRSVLDEFGSQDSFSLEHDFFPKLIGRGFYAHRVRSRFIDIGTPDSYRAASAFFRTLSVE